METTAQKVHKQNILVYVRTTSPSQRHAHTGNESIIIIYQSIKRSKLLYVCQLTTHDWLGYILTISSSFSFLYASSLLCIGRSLLFQTSVDEEDLFDWRALAEIVQ